MPARSDTCGVCGLPKNEKRKCPPCERRRKTAWVKAHPERARAAHRKGAARYKEKHPDRVVAGERKRSLRRNYGITVEQYAAMLAEQHGVCAICASPPSGRALAVDHNHATGKIRGLLCGNCNRGIGNLQDSIGLLYAAINYLDKQ